MFRLRSGKQRNRQTLFKQRVQDANACLVPFLFSTPFCENRYQIMAALAEWCCIFYEFSTRFRGFTRKVLNSRFLYRKFTAFAYTIRAPSSEIWHHNQVSKGGLRYDCLHSMWQYDRLWEKHIMLCESMYLSKLANEIFGFCRTWPVESLSCGWHL